MSATIYIRPSGENGKKLTLKDVLAEELLYGISDAYGRLEEGQEDRRIILRDPWLRT